MKKLYFLIAVLFAEINFCFSQDSLPHIKPILFIEPEFMIGRILPNYPEFPPNTNPVSFSVSIGKIDHSSDKEWIKYYNYPSIGIMFSYIRPGNDSLFGQEFSLMPYFELNPANFFLKHFHLKVGLGCSYFTKFYDINTNPLNKEIGSRFNWAFQTNLYYSFFENKRFMFMMGVGYIHSSNGHTQLPNYGINSFTLSVASKIFLDPQVMNQKKPENKVNIKNTNHYFLELREGIGIQEYGPAKGPAGNPKKPVYAFSVAGGIIFGHCFKLLTGFTYRFYKQHYDHIILNQTPGLIDNPILNASNIFFYIGFEMLFGYVSTDLEVGLNIHKPFYKDFYLPYASVTTTTYKLKSLIPTRLGLKFYLFDTNKIPDNNFYIGANINANYTQADFSELSIGYVRSIK
jgi:hypothetical protein